MLGVDFFICGLCLMWDGSIKKDTVSKNRRNKIRKMFSELIIIRQFTKHFRKSPHNLNFSLDKSDKNNSNNWNGVEPSKVGHKPIKPA